MCVPHFKIYHTLPGSVSCPWRHDSYWVIYAWRLPMAADWAYLVHAVKIREIQKARNCFEVVLRIRSWICQSAFKVQVYLNARVTRENARVEWRRTICPFFLLGFLGGVYMTPGRLSTLSEFTPVPSHDSSFVYMIPQQTVMPARVIPAWVHSGCCTVGRISLRYEISQRYHVNAKRPHVSVWNRSASGLERVAHA